MSINVDTESTNQGMELKNANLGFWEIFGQSIANLSPTFVPALNVAVVVALAGNGTWLVFGLACLGLTLVAINVGIFAKRISSTGSLFLYISNGLGSTAGIVAGWGLGAAYVSTAIAVLAGEYIFIYAATQYFGFGISSSLIYLLTMVLIIYLTYRDIRVSARVSIFIEAISITIVLVLLCAIMVSGTYKIVDMDQLSLRGTSFKGMAEGVFIAMFSLAAFDSGASLSGEAKNPLRTVHKVVISTEIIAGIFGLFVAYLMMIAFKGNSAVFGASKTPLMYITNDLGVPYIGPFMYFIAAISAFACVMASINAASRIFYSMARFKIVHRSMGLVHKKYGTPHVALLLISIFVLACVSLFSFDGSAINVFDLTGTFATFGFMTAYFLVSVAAPVYLVNNRNPTFLAFLSGVLGALFMLAAFVGSMYPVPPFPYNVIPYLYIAYLIVGIGWFIYAKNKAPQMVKLIEQDLEENAMFIIGKK